jgi:transcriptional regulator with XRE-family HTH domain
MSIAKNIKKLRQQNGISQDKLSKISGLTLNTISKIESGATLDPRVETLKKIAGALGSSVDALLR